jgi:CheY-like chemotaxis protein
MTANAYDEDVKKALDAGMNAHFSKPLNIQLLLGALSVYRRQC